MLILALSLCLLIGQTLGFAVPYQIQQQYQRGNLHLQQRPSSSGNNNNNNNNNPVAFLPGLGNIRNLDGQQQVRRQRSQLAANLTPNNLDNPFLTPNAAVSASSGNAGEKCSYMQMKGGPIPGANCHKGGMACEKQCGYDEEESNGNGGGGLNCRTVMEEVCEEVAAPLCQTITESICEPVRETVCDDDVEQEPRTR